MIYQLTRLCESRAILSKNIKSFKLKIKKDAPKMTASQKQWIQMDQRGSKYWGQSCNDVVALTKHKNLFLPYSLQMVILCQSYSKNHLL